MVGWTYIRKGFETVKGCQRKICSKATDKRRGPAGGGGRVSGEEIIKSVALSFAFHNLFSLSI